MMSKILDSKDKFMSWDAAAKTSTDSVKWSNVMVS